MIQCPTSSSGDGHVRLDGRDIIGSLEPFTDMVGKFGDCECIRFLERGMAVTPGENGRCWLKRIDCFACLAGSNQGRIFLRGEGRGHGLWLKGRSSHVHRYVCVPHPWRVGFHLPLCCGFCWLMATSGGMSAFLVAGVARVSPEVVFRGALPFYAPAIILLWLIGFFHEIATWLPDLLYVGKG